jgi:peptidase E
VDVIYVGGGNTKSMLALWREWGLDVILREAWQAGVILAGLSAGSICWFEAGVTDSIPGDLTVLPCLGFLPGSNCPHYDGEAARRPAYQRFVAEGEIADGYAADDGVGLHYIGTGLERVISSRPEAKAYRVERHDGRVHETPITPEYLGA